MRRGARRDRAWHPLDRNVSSNAHGRRRDGMFLLPGSPPSPPIPGPDGRPMNRNRAVLLLLILGGLLLSWAWSAFTVDDIFISMRFAANLAKGRGPVFNPGERVEGFSTPLWV